MRWRVRVPFIVFPSELPDTPDDNSPEHVATCAAIDFLYLWGLMCHPGDEAAQERLAEAIGAGHVLEIIREAENIFESVLVDSTITRWLAGAPDVEATIISSAKAAAFAGTVSGFILGWVIFRRQRADLRATASLTKAIRMVQDACTHGRRQEGRTDNIRKHLWPRYRPVAHLWAALQVWNDIEYGDAALATPAGMSRFLMMAEWFRREGEALKPLRAGEEERILREDETWKVRSEVSAEWPTFEVGCRDIDAWDLRKRIKPPR